MTERFTSDVEVLSGSRLRAKIDVSHGNLLLGGNGSDGDLALFRSSSTHRPTSADVNQTGEYSDTNWNLGATVWLNGQDGNMMLGGNGTDGDIALFPRSAQISQTDFSAATIVLDADSGDIVLRNADCAEEFDIDSDAVDPGSVMVLADSGALKLADRPYDTAVAGVISGGGDFAPALVLDRRPGNETRQPIALMGKTYCMVTDETGPIRTGDLLTTSSVAGHAMRAVDRARIPGAIVGKALRPHDAGQGMVPILVTLQ